MVKHQIFPYFFSFFIMIHHVLTNHLRIKYDIRVFHLFFFLFVYKKYHILNIREEATHEALQSTFYSNEKTDEVN